ncbi:MAG: hypothetical protein U1E76_25835 [Planctomycetota bacterium]
MLDLVGSEHAHTLLRQSVHYCVKGEEVAKKYYGDLAQVLAGVLERHHLNERELGERDAEDAWVGELSATLFQATPEQAADAVGGALASGYSRAVISEAISLTANQLMLRDAGRPPEQAQANKPVGSVHGDSIGVHASDAANAWRHIASVSDARNAAASLVLAGWHVASDRTARGRRFLEWQPRPLPEPLAKVTTRDPERLLAELDGAIRERDQERACAVAHQYLAAGHESRPVFDLMLRFATSEDGALHAEKYYFTVCDEFARTRPAFRNRQLVALARVTASEFGTHAPGYEQACQLLGCEA